jgi:hypothetical protein
MRRRPSGSTIRGLSLPKSLFFRAGGAAEISRRWNRRNARRYCFAPRQGRGIGAQGKEVSRFKVPSCAPAGALQVGAQLPAVPPPANIHRPFRAKRKNRLSRKIWVTTSHQRSGLARYGPLPQYLSAYRQNQYPTNSG